MNLLLIALGIIMCIFGAIQIHDIKNGEKEKTFDSIAVIVAYVVITAFLFIFGLTG